MQEDNATILLDEAIALAKLELQELELNTEDSLALADEYASKRYAIVNKAWESQKDMASSSTFKEKIQILYGLQKELLSVAEKIRETIAHSIKENALSNKAITKYKRSVPTQGNSVLGAMKG